jgi:hypothetical protein
MRNGHELTSPLSILLSMVLCYIPTLAHHSPSVTVVLPAVSVALDELLQGCKWYILWHVIQALPRSSLLTKCLVVLWYMCKCILIYAHKRSKIVPVSDLITLAWTKQQCVHISRTEFHPNLFNTSLTFRNHASYI